MAGYSLYDTFVLRWLAALKSLDAILTKAESHAKEKSIDANAQYIDAKIIDDMRPLTFQIQIVTTAATLPLGTLTGNALDLPSEDKTFADLHARIKAAQDLVQGVKPEDINGREDEIVKVPGPLGNFFPDGIAAKRLCETWADPNLYFHLVTAYNILRKEGVPLGKMDYLTPFMATS